MGISVLFLKVTTLKDVVHLDVCVLGRLISHSHAVSLVCFSKELEQKNGARRQAHGSNIPSTTAICKNGSGLCYPQREGKICILKPKHQLKQ